MYIMDQYGAGNQCYQPNKLKYNVNVITSQIVNNCTHVNTY